MKKTKHRYPYCEKDGLPSRKVVEEFSTSKRTGSTSLLPEQEDSRICSPQQAMFEDLESYYNIYHDWTAAYAAMNMD